MKKILALVLALALVLSCAAALAEKVGVSMPTKDLQRWVQDGENMEAQLKDAGFEVELQYASNDIATQLNQVDAMIDSGCNVIVIAKPEVLNAPFCELQQQMETLLRRAGVWEQTD